MAGFEFVHFRKRRGKNTCQGTAVCGICDDAIIVNYIDRHIVSKGSPVNLLQNQVDFPGTYFAVEAVTPRSGKDTPERLPDNVASFFAQGVTNEQNENWDAAGAMFRKSIDVGTKYLDPSLSGQTLFKRINTLAGSGRLTSDIATWAHEVRIDGNDSVHGDDPESKEDVAAIHEFSRAVLLYLFTLPALVLERSTNKNHP